MQSACSQISSEPDLETKAAQMLLLGFRAVEYSDTMALSGFLKQHPPGGFILFDYDVPAHKRPRNIVSPDQLKRLVSDLQQAGGKQLFIAVDQEGGKVARLKSRYGFTDFPSAKEMAQKPDDSIRYYYAQMAKMLHRAGVNFNLGPVVDLDVNPECPVIGKLERAYSADPNEVARCANIFIEEMNKNDIGCCLKHFPGHGSSKVDSHLGFTDVSESWTEQELLPYRLLLKEGVPGAIMTAHVFNSAIDSLLPATLSYVTLDGILRTKLGFKGLILSDDMAMSAITKNYGLREALLHAINAGVDLLIFSNNGATYNPNIANQALEIIVDLVRKNEITEERIDQSVQRIKKFKENYCQSKI